MVRDGMSNFIEVADGYVINPAEISHWYEDQGPYGSIFITMRNGSEIIIKNEYKRSFKSKLKELGYVG